MMEPTLHRANIKSKANPTTRKRDTRMNRNGSIVITDRSAYNLYMHAKSFEQLKANPVKTNPLLDCAQSWQGLSDFNTANPYYGGEPVHILVPKGVCRPRTKHVVAKASSYDFPTGSFLQLRSHLFLTSPELTFVRMARDSSVAAAAQIAMNLCGRYYLDLQTTEIEDRVGFITTPEKLAAFLDSAKSMHGVKTAREALRLILPNTGSPEETRMYLQFCLPCNFGGFGLRFDAMNFDVKAGRLAPLTMQNNYCIDMVKEKTKDSMEYDGESSHDDASADKRRRNELAALGWTVYPIDKSILYSAAETNRIAHLIAKHMGVRIRKPANWDAKYEQLRRDIGLPV